MSTKNIGKKFMELLWSFLNINFLRLEEFRFSQKETSVVPSDYLQERTTRSTLIQDLFLFILIGSILPEGIFKNLGWIRRSLRKIPYYHHMSTVKIVLSLLLRVFLNESFPNCIKYPMGFDSTISGISIKHSINTEPIRHCI